jgi:3-hydroxyisobutyrate dehydrogenase-like beta-hydroxyacid dehydrogenase
MRAHAERGGVLATSPADAAHGASVIMTCLMTAEIVREALLGAHIKGERMLEGRYEPEGKLAQHLKDVDLMLEVGHAVGAPLLATALHRQLLLAGVAAGWSERDNSSIMAVLRSLIERPGASPETAGPP